MIPSYVLDAILASMGVLPPSLTNCQRVILRNERDNKMTQFKKGNKYYTPTEFAPVVEAALKAWPDKRQRPRWVKQNDGLNCYTVFPIDDFPMELTMDVPDGSEVTPLTMDVPDGSEVTPLTVDEIRQPKRKVWCIDPDTNKPNALNWWITKECLISRGLNGYATKADCRRANGLEVE